MCAALLVASLATACGGGDGGDTSAGGPTAQAPGDGVPVVVDTDLALDDLVALAFLLSSPAAEVRAVTVSGTGEVRCPQGLTVIRGLLALTGDDDVPVACGRSSPLAGDHAFPNEWRDLADSGWGMDLSQVTAPATERSAVDLLGTTLRQGGVTLLTLGPLTNVAESLRAEPDLAEQVSSVVVMGGALDVPGNVSGRGIGSSTAEWNMYVDPTAAAEVVASGAPIVLVGLDATNQLPITGDFLELLTVNARTEPAKLVDRLIRNNPQVYTGEAYFWDALAAAVVLDPGLVTTEEAAITVLTTQGRDSGRTVRRPDGTTVTIAHRPRAAAFETLLLRTLDRLPPGAALATPPPPVGRAVIRFDGSRCSYEGPATVPSGRMRFTFDTTDPAWTGAVVGLTGERSIQAILAWLEAHPHSRDSVPGVRQVAPVPPRVTTYLDVASPSVATICASDEPVPLLAGTVTVE
ncbi:MAG: nucleoside hydrolase [Nocardioides sp.]|nr:nucleoside hydrolase [Nocardioides sp.]